MATVPHSLRVPEELESEIDRELARRGVREWSSGVLTLLDEAIRMSRCPGIVFVNSRTGRRAVVAGTGIDVWEVIASWRQLDKNYDDLCASYEWLSEVQLRAALNYYELYPDGIDERLAREAEWTPERVYEEYPFMRPSDLS